jgi:hypothetical protein
VVNRSIIPQRQSGSNQKIWGEQRVKNRSLETEGRGTRLDSVIEQIEKRRASDTA